MYYIEFTIYSSPPPSAELSDQARSKARKKFRIDMGIIDTFVDQIKAMIN